jgi:hypothetical protein
MDDHNLDDEVMNQRVDLPEAVRGLYFALRLLPDGRIIGIHRLLFHWALHIDVHEDGYEDRYCYDGLGDAIEGFLHWTGQGDPPGGWRQHPRTRRRRDPVTGKITSADELAPA